MLKKRLWQLEEEAKGKAKEKAKELETAIYRALENDFSVKKEIVKEESIDGLISQFANIVKEHHKPKNAIDVESLNQMKQIWVSA
jgi:hypothetical protein